MSDRDAAELQRRFLDDAARLVERIEATFSAEQSTRRRLALQQFCLLVARRFLTKSERPTRRSRRRDSAGVAIPDEAQDALVQADGALRCYCFVRDERLAAAHAIDPSVLGRLVEELAPGRTRKGTFYTPRPVVAFMCREALRAHFARRISLPATASDSLIQQHDAAGLSVGQRREVLAVLDELRILDPACGAGAFLVGMLHELTALDAALRPDAGRSGRDALRFVERTLCGVDIDPLAAEVARLRLALAVAARGQRRPDLVPRVIVADALTGGDPLGESAHTANASDALRWTTAFPDVFQSERGGFDIVISNPPYVRHERIDALVKRRLRADYGCILEGKSDLSVYFYVRGLQLLRDGGVQVYVSANSWLDAGYGRALQGYLLTQGHMEAVYERSGARDFADADVNTLISIIRRGDVEHGAQTRFVRFDDPPENAAVADGRRCEVRVGRDALLRTSAGPAAGGSGGASTKWGGRFLRAPHSFARILSSPFPLVALGRSPHWTISRGRRTGWDDFFYLSRAAAEARGIESEFLRPLVKSPAEFRACGPVVSRLAEHRLLFLCPRDRSELRGTAALRYIKHGESTGAAHRRTPGRGARWYDLGARPPADILLPIAFHERFFAIENDSAAEAHQRFALLTLRPECRRLRPCLLALLGSILVPLMAEVFGRRGLGQGALDLPPDDWRQILIPDPDALTSTQFRDLSAAWRRVASRPPLPLSAAVDDPDRRRLDEIVVGILGLSAGQRERLYEDVVGLVSQRLSKARAPVAC